MVFCAVSYKVIFLSGRKLSDPRLKVKGLCNCTKGQDMIKGKLDWKLQ
jgi:hypothetical protein